MADDNCERPVERMKKKTHTQTERTGEKKEEIFDRRHGISDAPRRCGKREETKAGMKSDLQRSRSGFRKGKPLFTERLLAIRFQLENFFRKFH